MTKRLLAAVLAATMTLASAPARQAAPPAAKPVKAKKSRKGMWIAIGVAAAAAVTVGAVLNKRIGNER